MPRPNLVLVMPDQLRTDSVGCFNRDREGGDGGAVTPNIDALAARGTRFTQAFSQHSVCKPSRASIFSGWCPHVAGHRTLDNLLKPWRQNLLRLCKDAGYHVAWAGMRGDTFAPGVTTASIDFAGSQRRDAETRNLRSEVRGEAPISCGNEPCHIWMNPLRRRKSSCTRGTPTSRGRNTAAPEGD